MNLSIIINLVSIVLLSGFFSSCQNENSSDVLSNYNVTWESQSENSAESMPVGGCDVGCNV
jgi:hypothetical protein